MQLSRILIVFALAIAFAIPADGRDGRPAPEFGTRGRADIPVPGDIGLYPMASAIDSAGRVLIAGHRVDAAGHRGFVLRLLPTGVIDANFGDGGWFFMPTVPALGFAPNTVTVFAALAVGSGYLYAAGYPKDGDARTCALVVSLTDAGSLKPGFGTSGSGAVCGPSGLPAGEMNLVTPHAPRIGIVVQGSQLLVTIARMRGPGYAYPQAQWLFGMTLAGAPDPTFGTAGLITLPSGDAGGLAVDGSGRLLISGSGTNGGLYFERRLLPAGILDSDFGQSGLALIPYPAVGFYAEPMQTFSMLDDRPTVNFRKYRDLFGNEGAWNYGFLRVTASGVADASVAAIPADTSTGYVSHPTLITNEQTGGFDTAAARDPFNRVVIAGPEIVRLLPDGNLDPSFGVNGYTDLPQAVQSELTAYVMQTLTTDQGGNAYVATRERNNQTPHQTTFRVMKFIGDTYLDNGFE